MPNEEKDPAESESTETEETEESESEEKEPTIKELMAEIADLKKQLTPSKEEPEESESEEKDGKEKPKVDPLHIDYAEYLKSQMGKSYPKEFDKLPLEVRIPAMKATLGATKQPAKPVKEGTVGKGTPINTFTPPGTNYKDIAKKIRSGQ